MYLRNTSRNGTEILIRLEKSQPVAITSWYQYLLFMMHHDKKAKQGVTPAILDLTWSRYNNNLIGASSSRTDVPAEMQL